MLLSPETPTIASPVSQHNDDSTVDCPYETTEITTYAETDPYTYCDGHFVGQDGFRVPANFAEFQQEFPTHVRNFVRIHTAKSNFYDREDREGDLNLYLMSLPLVSKFREPGTNGLPNGCTDRVMTFHPNRAYGASKARFLNYINFLLLNHLITLIKKSYVNPVERTNNLSYFPGTSTEGCDIGTVINEEYLHHMSTVRITVTHDFMEPLMVEQFRRFLDLHNPELNNMLDVLLDSTTFIEAQERLGLPEQLFTRARNRLNVLLECFHTPSLQVPRQRKVYRPRAPHQAGGTRALHR